MIQDVVNRITLNLIKRKLVNLEDETKVRAAIHEIIDSIHLAKIWNEAHPNELSPEALLPTRAPALWKQDRGSAESPPAFIKRCYAPWLGKGLLRNHLRQLDKPLYDALNLHFHRHPEEVTELDLPTKKKHTDGLISDVFEGGTVKVGLLGSEPADRAKALRRLAHNLQYRTKKPPHSL